MSPISETGQQPWGVDDQGRFILGLFGFGCSLVFDASLLASVGVLHFNRSSVENETALPLKEAKSV